MKVKDALQAGKSRAPDGQQFFIPGVFPSENQWLGWAKKHWAVYKKEHDAHKQRVLIALLQARISAPPTYPVVLIFRWVEKHARRDLDNVAAGGRKVIIDGLVEGGVVPDDTRRYVCGFTDEFPVPDKTKPGVWVTICAAGIAPVRHHGMAD